MKDIKIYIMPKEKRDAIALPQVEKVRNTGRYPLYD